MEEAREEETAGAGANDGDCGLGDGHGVRFVVIASRCEMRIGEGCSSGSGMVKVQCSR